MCNENNLLLQFARKINKPKMPKRFVWAFLKAISHNAEMQASPKRPEIPIEVDANSGKNYTLKC